MFFYPERNEILVLPFTEKYAQDKVLSELAIPPGSEKKSFSGWIEGNTFELTRHLNRPDNYSPIIKGVIDASSKGIIIFLNYKLMFSTRLFLTLWTVILIFFMFFFYFKYDAHLYGAISLLMAIINYLVVYLNFKKQVAVCHDLFVNVFDTTT